LKVFQDYKQVLANNITHTGLLKFGSQRLD